MANQPTPENIAQLREQYKRLGQKIRRLEQQPQAEPTRVLSNVYATTIELYGIDRLGVRPEPGSTRGAVYDLHGSGVEGSPHGYTYEEQGLVEVARAVAQEARKGRKLTKNTPNGNGNIRVASTLRGDARLDITSSHISQQQGGRQLSVTTFGDGQVAFDLDGDKRVCVESGPALQALIDHLQEFNTRRAALRQ